MPEKKEEDIFDVLEEEHNVIIDQPEDWLVIISFLPEGEENEADKKERDH